MNPQICISQYGLVATTAATPHILSCSSSGPPAPLMVPCVSTWPSSRSLASW